VRAFERKTDIHFLPKASEKAREIPVSL